MKLKPLFLVMLLIAPCMASASFSVSMYNSLESGEMDASMDGEGSIDMCGVLLPDGLEMEMWGDVDGDNMFGMHADVTDIMAEFPMRIQYSMDASAVDSKTAWTCHMVDSSITTKISSEGKGGAEP